MEFSFQFNVTSARKKIIVRPANKKFLEGCDFPGYFGHQYK